MATTAKQADTGTPLRPEASDFLDIDAHLSDEEIGVREWVRSFVGERIRPHIKEWYDEAVFPKEIVPAFAELGLLGMHLSGYGCAGKSAVEYGLALILLVAVVTLVIATLIIAAAALGLLRVILHLRAVSGTLDGVIDGVKPCSTAWAIAICSRPSWSSAPTPVRK